MKKIERLTFRTIKIHDGREYKDSWHQEAADEWFDTNITPINEAIDNAIEVRKFDEEVNSCNNVWFADKGAFSEDDTHKALLIGIEPIKQETALNLIDEILDSNNSGDIMGWNELHDKLRKAKVILEGT